jgi:hypothetical protein
MEDYKKDKLTIALRRTDVNAPAGAHSVVEYAQAGGIFRAARPTGNRPCFKNASASILVVL